MDDTTDREWAREIAAVLRDAPAGRGGGRGVVRPGFDERVMAAVRAAAAERAARGAVREALARAWDWVREPHALVVSPIGGTALAAALLVAAALGGRRMPVARGASTPAGSDTPAMPAATAVLPSAGPATAVPAVLTTSPMRRVQFVLFAPGAKSVTVAGDFNGWNTAGTPLVRASASGVWTAEVMLPPGRYGYAFVVDGSRWKADPSAPRALGDDFGVATSVIQVAAAGAAGVAP